MKILNLGFYSHIFAFICRAVKGETESSQISFVFRR